MAVGITAAVLLHLRLSMTATRLAFAVDYSQTALAWPCTPGQHFLLMCCLITKGTHNRGQGCVCTFVGFSFLRSPSMALFLLLNMIIWQGNRKPEQQIYRWICKVGLQQIKVSAEVWYIPFGCQVMLKPFWDLITLQEETWANSFI